MAIKYGQAIKKAEASSQTSMFGDDDEASILEPVIPECDPWTDMVRLNHEKEVVGIYISGHPLDKSSLS